MQIVGEKPSIEDFPPCLIVEEHSISFEQKKIKTPAFVSTLTRKKKARSVRAVGTAVGWKTMECEIPILHPLSPVFSEKEVVTQEPVSPEKAATQEPATQGEIITQELAIQNVTVTEEPVTQDEVDKYNVPLAQLFSQVRRKRNKTREE